jgi:hypothetical protein
VIEQPSRVPTSEPAPPNPSLQRKAPVVAHGKLLRFSAAQHRAGVTPRAGHASRHRLIRVLPLSSKPLGNLTNVSD